MKNTEKYLSQRNENRPPHRLPNPLPTPKQLKFQPLKKQPMPSQLLSQSATQSCEQTYRKHIYDQETMAEMIQGLKQENNQLRMQVRVQQTQINYYEEQEKSVIMGGTGFGGGLGRGASAGGRVKKLEIINLRLRKQVQGLEQELGKLKKTLKSTTIKQLQTTVQVYEQQLKSLTAKLTSHQNSTTNIQELNNIIQKQYHTNMKNKELKAQLEEKIEEVEQSGRVIRKLRNLVAQKNGEIEALRVEREKVEVAFTRNKIMEDFVPKAELLAKKKQMLAMTETIEKLEAKLMECEAKAQSLQQENIDNMNRETNKRKEILTQFQKFKKSHEALEEALALSVKKSNDSNIRLDKIPSIDGEFKKPKIPAIVKIDHIKQAIETMVYNLQNNSIDCNSAPLLLRASQPQTQQPEPQDDQLPKPLPNQQKISIREIIHCLEQAPIGLQPYEQKELLARYLVENESDTSEHINFDSLTNISYVRSIFKRVLKDYVLFTGDQITEQCLLISDFLKRNQHVLKAALSKASLEDPPLKITPGPENRKQRKRGQYRCQQYLQTIAKENQLNSHSIEFIKFWTLKLRDDFLAYKQFEYLFKVEGVCTFITEEQADLNQ